MILINNSDRVTSKSRYVIETGVGFVKSILMADPDKLTITSDDGKVLTFDNAESYETTIRKFADSTNYFVYEVQ